MPPRFRSVDVLITVPPARDHRNVRFAAASKPTVGLVRPLHRGTCAVGFGQLQIIAHDWRNNWVLFVHNLDAGPREVAFSVGLDGANAEQGKLLINLLSEDHSHADDTGKHRIVIEPYGYRWYRVGGLDYLLRRSEIDQPSYN
ncbi:MAG: hypothetical protein WCA23_09435 [Stellaceae bacterium]